MDITREKVEMKGLPEKFTDFNSVDKFRVIIGILTVTKLESREKYSIPISMLVSKVVRGVEVSLQETSNHLFM
ncbi:hypothetical protein SLEP1_g36109 [Rubroshorea leprosula]|uniref:Uncharacterized protein n=1 Tax=Rubroshorea leprosula TaxID=152421 RepID=A0AAV5KQF3_9ROSI|nr:hypothetical protein SLEP1_g36109 [Rubroshorea leprosula]